MKIQAVGGIPGCFRITYDNGEIKCKIMSLTRWEKEIELRNTAE